MLRCAGQSLLLWEGFVVQICLTQPVSPLTNHVVRLVYLLPLAAAAAKCETVDAVQPFPLPGCLHPRDLMRHFKMGCNAHDLHTPSKHSMVPLTVCSPCKRGRVLKDSNATNVCHLCLLQGLSSAAM